MRTEELNDGSLKALLILILIVANIALSVFAPPRPAREGSHPAQTPQNESHVARP